MSHYKDGTQIPNIVGTHKKIHSKVSLNTAKHSANDNNPFQQWPAENTVQPTGNYAGYPPVDKLPPAVIVVQGPPPPD